MDGLDADWFHVLANLDHPKEIIIFTVTIRINELVIKLKKDVPVRELFDVEIHQKKDRGTMGIEKIRQKAIRIGAKLVNCLVINDGELEFDMKQKFEALTEMIFDP